MDIGTIILTVVAILVGLAVLALIVWATVVFVALRIASKAANRAASSNGDTFGIDPDLRKRSIARQHERVKGWGNRS